MKIDSDDILKQNFSTKPLGFDKKEVRIFLKLVATVYEDLLNENILLKKQLAAIEAKEMDFTTKDDLKRFISTVERIKKEEIEKAEQEAALLIREAQLKTAAMIREAESEEDKIKIAISELKSQYRAFEERMKEVIESHSKLLNSFGKEEQGKVGLDTFSKEGFSASED